MMIYNCTELGSSKPIMLGSRGILSAFKYI